METAFISGKGGTGKSNLCAAFASLGSEMVLADCDVDAANLHLLFQPEKQEEEIFTGSTKANIIPELCNNCGICISMCRFEAIHRQNGQVCISEIACDGCGLCQRTCPEKAVEMKKNTMSRLYSGSFRYGTMVYGILGPAEENSGKLVNKVRDKARQIAKIKNLNTIIVDGPPGIGCPVISSITGTRQIVVVTEPSLSALYDLKRVLQLTLGFHAKTRVIINKYDLNTLISDKIENYCLEQNIQLAGKIPFDPEITTAMVNCKSLPEWNPDSKTTACIKEVYKKIFNHDKQCL